MDEDLAKRVDRVCRIARATQAEFRQNLTVTLFLVHLCEMQRRSLRELRLQFKETRLKLNDIRDVFSVRKPN